MRSSAEPDIAGGILPDGTGKLWVSPGWLSAAKRGDAVFMLRPLRYLSRNSKRVRGGAALLLLCDELKRLAVPLGVDPQLIPVLGHGAPGDLESFLAEDIGYLLIAERIRLVLLGNQA